MYICVRVFLRGVQVFIGEGCDSQASAIVVAKPRLVDRQMAALKPERGPRRYRKAVLAVRIFPIGARLPRGVVDPLRRRVGVVAGFRQAAEWEGAYRVHFVSCVSYCERHRHYLPWHQPVVALFR